MINIKKYKPVLVEWVDSMSQPPIWQSPDEVIDRFAETKDRIYSIQYLIHQNKMEYVFASSLHICEGKVITFGEIFTIPKGCVLKMKTIKL